VTIVEDTTNVSGSTLGQSGTFHLIYLIQIGGDMMVDIIFKPKK